MHQQGSTDLSASKINIENRNITNLKWKKVPFSAIEDNFIKQGILKYGNGRLPAILSEIEFKFNPSRKALTLAVRPKKLTL